MHRAQPISAPGRSSAARAAIVDFLAKAKKHIDQTGVSKSEVRLHRGMRQVARLLAGWDGSWLVARTSQRLCDRIKQHVPSSIRQNTVPQREQPSRASKTKRSLKHDSAIGQHLLDNPECAKAYSENCFRIIGRARSTFHLGILESVYIKTRDPLLCRQKEFVFALGLLK